VHRDLARHEDLSWVSRRRSAGSADEEAVVPDEVNVPRMTGEHAHAHKMSSWVVVALICVASIVLGIALVAQSLPLAILGAVIGVIGAVMGAVTRIMDDAY
jgi:energy-converting hydrogenase Eha subunit A